MVQTHRWITGIGRNNAGRKAEIAAPPDGRLYIPSDVDEAYRRFPGVGRRVRINYLCEYMGASGDREKASKRRTRTGVVIQKVKHEHGAHFTVLLEPENAVGRHGGYRLGFNFIDIITGKIKVQEVG